jgi:hypothetical protein
MRQVYRPPYAAEKVVYMGIYFCQAGRSTRKPQRRLQTERLAPLAPLQQPFVRNYRRFAEIVEYIQDRELLAD